jgi:hypothetical protein
MEGTVVDLVEEGGGVGDWIGPWFEATEQHGLGFDVGFGIVSGS